jgi:hypothetical protein
LLRDWRTWLLAGVIAAVVFAAFIPALNAAFVYDDLKNIVENSQYRGLGLTQLRWMFTTLHSGNYQPLSWVTLGLDYALWGKEPGGYHLTNLIVHCANAVLVYWLVLVLLRIRARSFGSTPAPVTGQARLGAAFAALLFAVHPLRAESVVWVTERRDVLSSLFLLITVLVYLNAHGAGTSRRTSRWMIAALVAYTLSLLSRAMGMTLPLILLVLDWYPLRRLPGGCGRWMTRDVRGVWLEKIPFLVLALGAGIVALLAQHQSTATLSLVTHGAGARLAQSAFGLVFYLWKTILPIDLVPLYMLDLPLDVFAPRYVVCELIVVVAAVGLLTRSRRVPAVIAVCICYTILLSPVLGLAQCGWQEVADRYSYLPSIGWAVLLGAGVSRLGRSHGARRILARATIAAGALVIGTFAILTWRQCLVWQTRESLWTHAVAHGRPNHIAYYNLGNAMAAQGRFEEAIECFHQTLQLTPAHPAAMYSMGRAYARLEKYKEATRWYREVIELQPGYVPARYNLATVLFKQGAIDETITQLEEVIRIDPDHTAARRARKALGAVPRD